MNNLNFLAIPPSPRSTRPPACYQYICIISVHKGPDFSPHNEKLLEFFEISNTSIQVRLFTQWWILVLGLSKVSNGVLRQIKRVCTRTKRENSILNRRHQSRECHSFGMHQSWREKCIFSPEQWVSVTPLSPDVWKWCTVAGYTFGEWELQASEGVEAPPLRRGTG